MGVTTTQSFGVTTQSEGRVPKKLPKVVVVGKQHKEDPMPLARPDPRLAGRGLTSSPDSPTSSSRHDVEPGVVVPQIPLGGGAGAPSTVSVPPPESGGRGSAALQERPGSSSRPQSSTRPKTSARKKSGSPPSRPASGSKRPASGKYAVTK